jgi:hypothetical protein
MISDLRPISSDNRLVKFADDLTLLVPESTDTPITDEFLAIRQWANENKLTINAVKTKELVFHRPKPSIHISPPVLDGIERVLVAKLLGVTLNPTLSFSEHVANIIKQCNQRSFLLRSLRRNGLRIDCLNAVFNALVLSRILYCISAWGGFIGSADVNRIDSVFKKSKKFGQCLVQTTFEQLLVKADRKLFKKCQANDHCLHHLLPAIRSSASTLRERGHPFILPHCNFTLFKHSYITRMLFSQV